ncbi:family 43 glycosylhydrolase [Hymenobacter swuensis]|nr:family 43 glycosylhydrolase [Hymenobacter swuensis]
MKTYLTLLFRWLIVGCLLLSGQAVAQQSDNEYGTYTNPVIWSDFPDNDVIRVGDMYYMVATTMYYFPGVPLLQSRDLVNWEYVANTVPRLDVHPAYNLQGGARYGHGQWASSLRYHHGRFYVLFMTLDEGGFLCTAEKAEGPWTLQRLPKAYYDAGLFFDDDGRRYIVHGYSKLSVTAVDEQLAPLGPDSVIVAKGQRPGLEGSHVYKINGFYYLFATYGGPDGYQVALRSKSIYGPYEEKIVLRDDMNLTGMGVHQGALVETQTGEWWSIIFQDRGGVGRVPTLQPVTWVDGWPLLGENGRAVVTHKKPDVGRSWPVRPLPTSDEFNQPTLGLQWAWNHNPDPAGWSLTQRPGFLRLTSTQRADSLKVARNTLTQRMFGPYSVATVALQVGGMQDGDVSGLAVFQNPYAYVAVTREWGRYQLVMMQQGRRLDSVRLDGPHTVYLQARANTTTDMATFAYSLDNRQFRALGAALSMKFSLKMFTGNRFALFHHSTRQPGGYVDIDWFRMTTRQGPPNRFAANSRIEAEFYDERHGADTGWSQDVPGEKNQDITQISNGGWLAFHQVDFGKGGRQMQVRVAALQPGATIEVYQGGLDSAPIGRLAVSSTGGWKQYQTLTTPLPKLTGKQKIFLKFIGGEGELLRLNWLSFADSPR